MGERRGPEGEPDWVPPRLPVSAPIPLGVRLPIDGPAATPERVVEVARLAERLGYRTVWASDHVIIPSQVRPRYHGTPTGEFPFPPEHQWLEPLTTLAWVASACPRLEVATGILVLPQRNWLVVGKQAATLAHLSGGRFTLGIGVGWMEEEFRILGASFEDRVARTREAVSTLRRLWAGGDLEGARMRPTPPGGRIQVLWGGYTRAARRCVAELGDGWLSADPGPAELAAGVAELRELAERAGRDPSALRVAAKPGVRVRATADLVAELAAAGATDFVVDPPHAEGRERALEEIQRVAEECRLQAP
jgi:probable F420-dependent oxidoreductase